MLVGIEYEQAQNLLRQLSPEALKSLKDTVTKNLIATESVEESISAILQYSTSGQELLSRKKMKRNYLFQYLHKVGVPVNPKSEKDALIQTTLNYWNILGGKTAPEVSDPLQHAAMESASTSSTSLSQEDSDQLAEEFIGMFYDLVNNMAIDNMEPNQGSNYFDHDCSLLLSVKVGDDLPNVETIEGAENVWKKFYNLSRMQKLYFVMSDCNASPSGGLVKLDVTGDVSKLHFSDLSEVIGSFEQTFHLKQTTIQSWVIGFCDLSMTLRSD